MLRSVMLPPARGNRMTTLSEELPRAAVTVPRLISPICLFNILLLNTMSCCIDTYYLTVLLFALAIYIDKLIYF